MPEIVQRIDFVLSLQQILKMCISNEDTTGIMLTLGITDKAEIIFTTEGVCWNGTSMRSTSEPTRPCPIPPDCPAKADCVNKLTELMPASVNASQFINIENANEFINR